MTKKPYAKHLLLLLLEGETLQSLPPKDLAKLAREVFKQLTSEDFMQLSREQASQMNDYENKYT